MSFNPYENMFMNNPYIVQEEPTAISTYILLFSILVIVIAGTVGVKLLTSKPINVSEYITPSAKVKETKAPPKKISIIT